MEDREEETGDLVAVEVASFFVEVDAVRDDDIGSGHAGGFHQVGNGNQRGALFFGDPARGLLIREKVLSVSLSVALQVVVPRFAFSLFGKMVIEKDRAATPLFHEPADFFEIIFKILQTQSRCLPVGAYVAIVASEADDDPRGEKREDVGGDPLQPHGGRIPADAAIINLVFARALLLKQKVETRRPFVQFGPGACLCQ